MKRLHTHSQHFIRRPALVKELIGHSKLKKHETVIDIGAGSGVISSVLATRVKQVVAVEVESRTVEILKKNLQAFDNVSIYEGNFLDMELPHEPYSIFANIPFHLSSPIIRRLIETNQPPRTAYFILQKQFAKKLVASDITHFTGQLGMLLGARYEVKVRKPLRKTDFWPHPAVDTVFLEMICRETPLVQASRFEAYEKFTVECFSDPTIYRKLPLAEAGVSAEKKPSQLSLEQWVHLFKTQTHY
ncbi:methyltransferase [Candidatus Saccharibacteria bacterium]|nr:methyltransferase [Candidatus Saccharibacteria bacterium]